MRDTPKFATCLYLQLTVVFSAVVWTLVVWSGHVYMGFGVIIPALMWCPGLAALVTCRMLGRELRSIAWQWPESKYLAAAYLLPLAYASFAYGAVWTFHLGGWNSEFVGLVAQDFGLHGLPSWASLIVYILAASTGGVILNMSTALGEEIGWRGFLVPELAKQMSFSKISLLSGLIWAVWHSPMLLLADYNAGTNRWYALGCSSITVASVGIMLGWLRLKSNSVWPAALLHASHNVFVPGLFDNFIRNTGQTLWYTTEFGAALAIASALFAAYIWSRRDELQQSAKAAVRAAPLGNRGLYETQSSPDHLLKPRVLRGSQWR